MRALEGLGETFYFPASMSLVSDYHGARTRSRALSFHQSSVYIGTIVGNWLGAWFAENVGWRFGFYFFGGMGVLLALALYRFLHEPARGQAETTGSQGATPESTGQGPRIPINQTLRAIYRTPTVPLLMLAFLAANFVAPIFLALTPTFS